MDCKLQKNAFHEYFLIIPQEVKCPSRTQEVQNPVAVDPGVRKFLTTYAPSSEEAFMMGNRWSTTIMNILVTLDHLYSERAKGIWRSAEKKKKDKEIMRLRKRVFYLKKELKDQCAHFLASRYDAILIPKLEVTRLCSKGDRRLKTKVVRSMLQAGHGDFFNRLKEKCEEKGKVFLHVREEYTSQTCPNCGMLHKCGEVYHCRECGFRHDRDLVGALNIFLKAVRRENPYQCS